MIMADGDGISGECCSTENSIDKERRVDLKKKLWGLMMGQQQTRREGRNFADGVEMRWPLRLLPVQYK